MVKIMSDKRTSVKVERIELFGGPCDGDMSFMEINTLKVKVTEVEFGDQVVYDRRMPYHQWHRYAEVEGIPIPFDYRYE